MVSIRGLHYACVSLVFALVLSGCAMRRAPGGDQGAARGPESLEKRMFRVMSEYYCAHSAWPPQWDQFVEFAGDQGGDTKVYDTVKSPVIDSPRAIVLTLGYQREGGVRRKVTFIAPPSCSKDENKDKQRVSIVGGRVGFVLPDGFSLMKGEPVKEYWKKPPRPDAAWQAANGVVIAIRFGDVSVQPEELLSFSDSITEAYDTSVPGLVWRQREPLTSHEPVLLRHEFESDSSRGRLLNFVISTSFDGRLLAITIVGVVEEAESIEQAAERLLGSLEVR